MYKQPETFEDILNYPTEDPNNYKITKQLRFLLVGCKIFGLKTMGDLRKKERWVLQKYEFWRRKNKKHLGKAYFMGYDAGIDLMRDFLGRERLHNNGWMCEYMLHEGGTVVSKEKTRLTGAFVTRSTTEEIMNNRSQQRGREAARAKRKKLAKTRKIHDAPKDVRQFVLL